MEILDIGRLRLVSIVLPIIRETTDPGAAEKVAAVEPLRWFIELAAQPKGLPLTALGNVGAKVVQAADELFEWYIGHGHGWKPRTENDLGEITALREMANSLRLIRKQRSALLATKRGIEQLANVPVLWELELHPRAQRNGVSRSLATVR